MLEFAYWLLPSPSLITVTIIIIVIVVVTIIITREPETTLSLASSLQENLWLADAVKKTLILVAYYRKPENQIILI